MTSVMRRCVGVEMRPNEILACWENSRYQLSAKHRAAFLKRRELAQIGRYPSELVREAIVKHARLDAALKYLESRPPSASVPARPRKPNSPAPSRKRTPAASKSKARKNPPKKKRTRQSQRGTRDMSNTINWGNRAEHVTGPKRYCPSCGLLEVNCKC